MYRLRTIDIENNKHVQSRQAWRITPVTFRIPESWDDPPSNVLGICYPQKYLHYDFLEITLFCHLWHHGVHGVWYPWDLNDGVKELIAYVGYISVTEHVWVKDLFSIARSSASMKPWVMEYSSMASAGTTGPCSTIMKPLEAIGLQNYYWKVSGVSMFTNQ